MKSTNPGSENKFAAILQARNAPTGADTADVATAQRPPVATAAVAVKFTGRPGGKGKSSDPNFRQVTAYIPQQLHTNATIALRLANQERVDADKEDFSELLTHLLADWYQQQTYYRPGR